MEEVVRQREDQKINKYRLYAFASIACPILAYVGGYFERLNYYANLTRSNSPELPEQEVMAFAATRVQDNFGEWLFYVWMATIVGLVLAAISIYLKQKVTIISVLAFVINGVPFLFFVYLTLAYQMLKASFAHS